jgi:hypothetical protein
MIIEEIYNNLKDSYDEIQDEKQEWEMSKEEKKTRNEYFQTIENQ